MTVPQNMPVSGDRDDAIVCPSCSGGALNRYGRLKSGKQRYLCLVCGRQFVVPSERVRLEKGRPDCPLCGRPMHVYAREASKIRFRCSAYPECRSYLCLPIEEID